MDAFYASIEQRDDPDLRGKPIAVGGSSSRGVVAAASYEARQFGVYSAMSSKIAARKCPSLIFVKPRFEVYRATSLVIRCIFKEYTDLIEPLSLDEAYLDVTENKLNVPSASIIAKQIKQKIKDTTGLIASAGVSVNKFLAKIASDYDKPDGFFVITPEQAPHFVDNLPIEKFHGIGKVTAEKMHRMGITKGADLKQYDENQLVRNFGKVGMYYYQIARGIDERPVNPNRDRKSVGAENTFHDDLLDQNEIRKEFDHIVSTVWQRVKKAKVNGKTVTVKIRTFDFNTITRSRTLSLPLQEEQELKKIAEDLLMNNLNGQPIRLLGVTVSSLSDHKKGMQLTLDL